MKKTRLKKDTRPSTAADVDVLTLDVATLTVELPKMEARLASLIRESSANTNKEIGKLHVEMDKRFDRVHEDINKVLAIVNHLDEKFSPLIGKTVRPLGVWKPARPVRRT